MGVPTNTYEETIATFANIAADIRAFTARIENLANSAAQPIPVDIEIDPVASIGRLSPPTGPSHTGLTANTAAFSGAAAPDIISTSITQLSVPSAPSAPVLNFGTAPTYNLPTVPTSPTLQTTVVPLKPTLAIPTVPELAAISLPVLSTPTLPTYDLVLPEVPDDLLAPVASFEYSEETYISDELTNLRTLLNDDLVNGGWGVTHQDEEDLFERQRERIRDDSLLQEEDLFDSFSARGFEVPQGDQIDQIRVLQKQTLDKLQEVNLDISVQRADLIRKSRENVIAQVNSLNGTMIQYHGFVQQRLLRAAEFLAGHAINQFNAKVSRHNLIITAYNSSVGAYQAQVNAAVSQIQISKVAIEAEALKNDINRSTVQLYQSQIEAAATLIRMYQTEVDAAKTVSDIERDKLEIYRTEIGAYKTQVDAEVSKASLYATQLGAEQIKSRVFATNVGAYEAEVRANIGEQQTRIEEANLRIRENGLRLERYRSDIDLYRANIQKGTDDMRLQADLYGTETTGYGVYASAFSSWVSNLVQEENIEVQASIQESEVESRNARFNSESLTRQAKLQSDAATAAASVFTGHVSALAEMTTNLDIDIL